MSLGEGDGSGPRGPRRIAHAGARRTAACTRAASRRALRRQFFLGMRVDRDRRRIAADRAVRGRAVHGQVRPGRLQRLVGRIHALLHAGLHVADGGLELALHLLEFLQFDGPVHFRLDVGDIALRLAQQRPPPCGPRAAGAQGPARPAPPRRSAPACQNRNRPCRPRSALLGVDVDGVRISRLVGVGDLLRGRVDVPSFMPSLKPLTAAPRSPPTLRSFLVPKTAMTTTSTISQCQCSNHP
ncbi:hypothetical protein Ddc_23555 [Ditylenchus destructor]|nr:hypothetical protein Ddc_23555 [Ditylenchus destructor]